MLARVIFIAGFLVLIICCSPLKRDTRLDMGHNDVPERSSNTITCENQDDCTVCQWYNKDDFGEIAPKCECKNVTINSREQFMVNCHNKNFTEIPSNIESNVTILILSGNKINKITKLSAHMKELETLDLGHNPIFSWDEKAFDEIHQLKELFLDHCDLNVTKLNKELFVKLTNLTALHIEGNNKEPETIIYDDELFSTLAKLEEFSLDITTPILDDWDNWKEFDSLRKLYLNGFLKQLSNETLSCLADSPLEHLRISYTGLESIEPKALIHFPKLNTLDLSFNPQLGFRNVSQAWSGLAQSNCNLSNLILVRITPYGSVMEILDLNFFEGLESMKITSLNLDGNNIVAWAPVFHIYMPNLSSLSVMHNRLESLSNVKEIMEDFKQLPLTFLYAASQNQRYPQVRDHDRWFEYLIPVFSCRDQRPDFKKLENHHSTTDLSCYIPTYEYQYPFIYTLPSTIQVIELGQTLGYPNPQGPMIIFLNGSNVYVLRYPDNRIIHFNNTVMFETPPADNFTLDLSRNEMEFFLADELFPKGFEHYLKILNLSRNNLGDFLASAKPFDIFKDLEELYLSDNTIRKLAENILNSDHRNIKILDISHNKLKSSNDINICLTWFEYITDIDLSHNLLPELHEYQMNNITALAESRSKSTAIKVKLIENPFVCGCEQIDFLKWMERGRYGDHGYLIVDLWHIDCTCPKNKDERCNYYRLNRIIEELEQKCNGPKWIIILTVLIVVLAVIIILAVCCKRHALEIHMVLFHRVHHFWCPCCNSSHIPIERQSDSIENYDCFVAYHRSSSHMIPNFMEKLERNASPIKACFHDRDFVIGEAISQNIITSINSSKKIMLLLSKEFIESDWCQFEVELSVIKCLDLRKNILIPVIMEPFREIYFHENARDILKHILRVTRYYQYPSQGNSQDVDMFWKNLLSEIRNQSRNQPLCKCGIDLPERMPNTSSIMEPFYSRTFPPPSPTQDGVSGTWM